MNRLRRIEKLETGSAELSPMVRLWLGQPLTDNERNNLDRSDPEPFDPETISKECRAWLGID